MFPCVPAGEGLLSNYSRPTLLARRVISSHLKDAFGSEKFKFFFAFYATVHDDANAVGPWIPKDLFEGAAVLNDDQHASFNVGRDPTNHARQV
jgi:hypothetical protein